MKIIIINGFNGFNFKKLLNCTSLQTETLMMGLISFFFSFGLTFLFMQNYSPCVDGCWVAHVVHGWLPRMKPRMKFVIARLQLHNCGMRIVSAVQVRGRLPHSAVALHVHVLIIELLDFFLFTIHISLET